MKDYLLASEDDHSFTLKHPDGSDFKIAKVALAQAMLDKIRGFKPVQKMAEGGIVGEDDPNLPPVPDAFQDSTFKMPGTNSTDDHPFSLSSIAPGLNPLAGLPEDASNSNLIPESKDSNVSGNIDSTPQAQVTSPVLAETPKTQTANNGQASSGSSASGFDPLKSVMNGFTQIKGGYQGIANAKNSEAKSITDAYTQNQTENDKVTEQFKPLYDQISNERSRLVSDIVDQKIDPSRLWANASTGEKISAAIGLVLSGIGSGLTGQPNGALQVINKAIESDIEAQKSDLNKKVTLYSMNLDRYKDASQAELKTRIQLNTALEAKLRVAAAQSNSAMAQSQAQIAIGGINREIGMNQMQLAMMQAQAQSLGAGGAQGGLPVGREPLPLLSDPKYQEKRVVVGNRAFQAGSSEDAKELKNMTAEYGPVRGMVQELGQLGPSALIPGSAANLKALQLRANLVPRLNKLHGLNRLSEEDIKLMGNQIKDPTSFAQLLNGGVKNNQFLQNLNDDLESNYSTRLIGYKGPASFKSFNKLGQVK